MTIFRATVAFLVLAVLSGCGGVELTCDDVRTYQIAVEGQRIEAPEGLDDLDPLKEIPLPEASPREPRPPGSKCIDRPPEVSIGG